MEVFRRRLAWLLLTAMVLWQMLGLLHGTVHARGESEPDAGLHAAHAAHATQVAHAADQAQPAPAARLTLLFAGHDQGSGDCRLLDQLSHSHPFPTAVAPCVATLAASGFVPAPRDAIVARKGSRVRARSPPSFS